MGTISTKTSGRRGVEDSGRGEKASRGDRKDPRGRAEEVRRGATKEGGRG